MVPSTSSKVLSRDFLIPIFINLFAKESLRFYKEFYLALFFQKGLFKWKWIGDAADYTGFLGQKMVMAMSSKANKQIKGTKDSYVTCLKIILPEKVNDQLRSSCQLTPGTWFSKMQLCWTWHKENCLKQTRMDLTMVLSSPRILWNKMII